MRLVGRGEGISWTLHEALLDRATQDGTEHTVLRRRCSAAPSGYGWHRDYENDKHDKHDETDNIDDDDDNDDDDDDEENRENRPNQENQENHNDDNYEDKTNMTRYDQNMPQKKTTKEFYYHLPSYYFYEWIFRSFTHWKIFQVQV